MDTAVPISAFSVAALSSSPSSPKSNALTPSLSTPSLPSSRSLSLSSNLPSQPSPNMRAALSPVPSPSSVSSSPVSTPPSTPSARSISFSTSTILALVVVFLVISSFVFGIACLVAPSWTENIDDIYDLLIAEAYYLIPAFMCYFLYRYPFEIHIRYRFIFICFIHFIVLCGSTHFIRVMQFQNPAVLSFSKLLTAIVSVLTALLMIFIIPEALSLPLYTKQLERDLTEKYYQLKEAARRTKAANKSKDEFMAFLCHEIRNPLHCVCSNIDFLSECLDDITTIIEMKRHLPEFQHQANEFAFKLERLHESAQYVKSIQASSELMTHIVNDVLDISRLRSGHIVFERAPLDLRELASLSVQHFSSIAAARKIKLDFLFDTDISPFVYSDRNRPHQILFNLISNCMKFTKEGGVRVMVLTQKKCRELDEAREKEGFVLLNPTSDEDDSTDGIRTDSSTSDEEKKNDTLCKRKCKDKDGSKKRQEMGKKKGEKKDNADKIRPLSKSEEKNTANQVHFIDILGGDWAQPHSHTMRNSAREDDPESEPSKSLLAAPSSTSSTNTSPSSSATDASSSSSSFCSSTLSCRPASFMEDASAMQAARALSSLALAASGNSESCENEVVCLRFEDDGPGISESARKNLFTPFTAAKLTTIRTSAGLGLGIVKHLANIMKGTLTVQTKMGRGTIFTVTIPFERANEAAARKYAEEHNQIATKLSAADRSERDRRLKMYLRRYSSASNLETANAARAASEAANTNLQDSSTLTTPRPQESNHCSPSLPASTIASPRFANAITHITASSPVAATKTLLSMSPSSSTTIPLTAAHSPSSMHNTIANGALSPPARGKPCVLVVDDNEVNRKLMVRMCQQSGMDTEEAADGKLAVEATVKRRDLLKADNSFGESAQPYLVILMDISMPVMNGYESTQEIRRLGFTLPIIAVTANALSEEKSKALDAGMDAFVTKPIRRHEIVKVIERVVLEYEKREKPEKTASKLDLIVPPNESPIALVPIGAISSFGKHKAKKISIGTNSLTAVLQTMQALSLSQSNTPANIIASRSIAQASASPSKRTSISSVNNSSVPSPSLMSTTLSTNSGNASACASSPSARSSSLSSSSAPSFTAAPQFTPAASSSLQNSSQSFTSSDHESELSSLKLAGLPQSRLTYGTTSNSLPASPSQPLL